MASSVSGYSTFSQCSIDTMQPVLAAASCVTAAEYADVTVAADVVSVTGEGGLPFTLPFTVTSAGNSVAEDAVFTVTLSRAHMTPVTVDWETDDGTAASPGDASASPQHDGQGAATMIAAKRR